MSEEGLNAAAKEASYQDITLSAGWKELSVRRLEVIRGFYPKKSPGRFCGHEKSTALCSPTDSNLLPQAKECSPVTQNVTQLEQRDSAAKEKKHSANIGTSVEEFVAMANSIDWQAVEGDERLYSLLTKARHELMYAAHLAIPMSVRSYAKQTYLITSSFAAVLLR
jgi:hypothetical protein